jgi:hypothetical protein
LLDAALDTYPMAPLPEGFVAGTMSRIDATARRQLEMLDVAVLGSVLGLAATALVTWWSLDRVDPLWLERLRLEYLKFGLLISDVRISASLVVLAGAVVLSLSVLPALVLLTERRGTSSI